MIILDFFKNPIPRCILWGIIGGIIGYNAENMKDKALAKIINTATPLFFFLIEVVINFIL